MNATVSALVLTIGESSTSRAIEALQRQTRECDEIILVEDISPFHRAMNEGISRVRTDFFLQCDADMVPDPDCVEVLLENIAAHTGVVIAHLQDDLMGKIQAIKLFRTRSARALKFADHVSPDTNLITRMAEAGWKYDFARRKTPKFGHDVDILGRHAPDYSPLYTFQKFRLEGARMAKRGVFQELMDSLDRFGKSDHQMAKIALIGLCRGIFDTREGDGLSRYLPDEDFQKLKNYMDNEAAMDRVFDPMAN